MPRFKSQISKTLRPRYSARYPTDLGACPADRGRGDYGAELFRATGDQRQVEAYRNYG